MSPELLFVYGTLRRDCISPMDSLLSRHCDFFAPARCQGTLYDIAGYPGVTASNNPHNHVYGELYRVRNARQLWPPLDHYEHCSNAFSKPQQYVRKKQQILYGDNESVRAWLYLYNWKTGGLRKIASGDYLRYLQSNL